MQLVRKFIPMAKQFPKEHLFILLSLFIFLQFPYMSRFIDASSAPIDPGALSAIMLAISALLIFKALTWWLIKNLWPVFAEYSNEHFERNFKSLLSWQKVCIYLAFYMLLLYGFIAVMAALV